MREVLGCVWGLQAVEEPCLSGLVPNKRLAGKEATYIAWRKAKLVWFHLKAGKLYTESGMKHYLPDAPEPEFKIIHRKDYIAVLASFRRMIERDHLLTGRREKAKRQTAIEALHRLNDKSIANHRDALTNRWRPYGRALDHVFHLVEVEEPSCWQGVQSRQGGFIARRLVCGLLRFWNLR